MKTKKLGTKPRLRIQLAWFIGIYIASVIALGAFHEISKLLINILKS